MRKRLCWMAVYFVLSVSGAAAFWFFTADTTTGDLQTVDNATAQEAPKPAKIKSSPILGKEIPGLPEYCADKLISVSGCDGITEITTDQGNTYRLVEIGGQCWFADNLKEIPTTDQGWYGYYNDAEEEPAPGEGLLYTWDAAMNGEIDERAQGVCPTGWHVPTVCDFAVSLSSFWSVLERTEKPGLARSSMDFQTGKIYRRFGSMGEMSSLWSSSRAGSGAMSMIYDGSTKNIIGDLKLSPSSKSNALSTKCLINN